MRRNRGECRPRLFRNKAFSDQGFSQTRPFCSATARRREDQTGIAGITKSRPGRLLTKPFWRPGVVVLKQTGTVVGLTELEAVMPTLENDSAHSEGWDPALWSIGTVLGVAIVYLACMA